MNLGNFTAAFLAVVKNSMAVITKLRKIILPFFKVFMSAMCADHRVTKVLILTMVVSYIPS